MNRLKLVKFTLLGAGILVTFLLPYLLPGYYVSLISIVFIVALLASSINMLAGDAGLVTLGHAGIAAAAGYGLAWASRQGFDLWAQLGIAALLTLIASLIYALISMRTSGIYFLMVTLAAGMVFYGIAYRWSAVTGGDNGLAGIRRPAMLAEYWQFYFFAVTAFIVVTAALVVVSRSPFGLALRGIRDSESRMRSLGYNIPAYKFVAVLLSGAVAGLAGVLTVWQNEFISPSAGGFQASAIALIMVVLGGIGTLFGPLIGATLVVSIEHVLSSYVDRWPLILGLILIASVLFAPQGLDGGFRGLASRLRFRRPHMIQETTSINEREENAIT